MDQWIIDGIQGHWEMKLWTFFKRIFNLPREVKENTDLSCSQVLKINQITKEIKELTLNHDTEWFQGNKPDERANM